MPRLTLLSILAATAALALLPGRVQARTVPLRGQLIINTASHVGSTGECTCERQWFTVGLEPGRMKATATMGTAGDQLALTWGMRMTVLRGSQPIGTTVASCNARQRHCASTVRVSATISHRGVYYIRIDGIGGHYIPYTIRISGNVFRLSCRKGRC